MLSQEAAGVGTTEKSASGLPGAWENRRTRGYFSIILLPVVSAFQELRALSLLLNSDSLPGPALNRAVSTAAGVVVARLPGVVGCPA